MLTERILIEGRDSDQRRFSMVIAVAYEPGVESAETGICRAFGTSANNFSQVAIEQGWRYAHWTYPSGRAAY